uniref:Uncharacterized protein LOC114330736 n=1 Tax=Diabrotica virgifera virgifera TaxID=50390 RepID=A0A6P7FJ32_DIAVI
MGAILYSAFVWIIIIPSNMYLYYMATEFQYYQLSVAVFFWNWLNRELIKRFRTLNKTLKNTIVHKNVASMPTVTASRTKVYTLYQEKIKQDLQKIACIYNSLCNTVDLLNDVFGFTIFFTALHTMAYVVYFTLFLAYTTGSYYPFTANQRLYLAILCIVWIVESFMKISAASLSGEQLARESNNTISISYGLLHTLRTNPQCDVDGIKKCLKFLIQQASYRSPVLSASGFFVARAPMMGFMVGHVTSYVIIALQFLNGKI